jgi:hypothetical protein
MNDKRGFSRDDTQIDSEWLHIGTAYRTFKLPNEVVTPTGANSSAPSEGELGHESNDAVDCGQELPVVPSQDPSAK